MRQLTLIKPDDWHVHLRQDAMLKDTLAASSQDFARALIMPNLVPPLTTVEHVQTYHQQILKYKKNEFTPFYSLYFTNQLSIAELQLANKTDNILGVKLYPQGATTNSDFGVADITSLYPLFEQMQSLDLVLQVHGEITHGDIFAREAQFVEDFLLPITKNFPKLRIVLEHISTAAAADFVREASENIAATITIHHLLYNRNHLLSGGIKPHFYCLPILKSEKNQKAIQLAALSGSSKFFLGSDSAPHSVETKESACGCAGIFSSAYALPLYTQFFDNAEKIDLLENFASVFGAHFYRLPTNSQTITLINKPRTIPSTVNLGDKIIVPIAANETILWQVVNNENA